MSETQEQSPVNPAPTVEAELSNEIKKVLAFISGLSKRALVTQIKAQMQRLEKADQKYLAMLKSELEMRMAKEHAKKG